MISADLQWLPGPSQPSAPFGNISSVRLVVALEGKEDAATTTSTAAFASQVAVLVAFGFNSFAEAGKACGSQMRSCWKVVRDAYATATDSHSQLQRCYQRKSCLLDSALVTFQATKGYVLAPAG